MTKETDIRSSLVVKPALSKSNQCTPQLVSCTTYTRAPNIFRIQVAEVMAAILGITAKKFKGKEGEHWKKKNLACGVRGFIIFKQQLKELAFCWGLFYSPICSTLFTTFFFHFKFKF